MFKIQINLKHRAGFISYKHMHYLLIKNKALTTFGLYSNISHSLRSGLILYNALLAQCVIFIRAIRALVYSYKPHTTINRMHLIKAKQTRHIIITILSIINNIAIMIYNILHCNKTYTYVATAVQYILIINKTQT